MVRRAQALGGVAAIAMVGVISGCAGLRIPEAGQPAASFVLVEQPAALVQADRPEERDDGEVPELEPLPAASPLEALARAPRSSRAEEGPTGTNRQAEFEEKMRQHFPDWQGSWCPLVLSFDDRPVRFDDAQVDTRFDAGGATACERMDWPTSETPWLVHDLDANGIIDGGHELFGAGTRMPDGTFASNGFAALATLDDDGDGWLTPADSAWSSLALWADHNRNRRTDPGELRSLDDAGVRALALEYAVDRRCDARGNCVVERSTFLWHAAGGMSAAGAIVDVHLACRSADTP